MRARVEGTVQGVGFRPFVYRLARELGLGGFVLNDEQGVVVEVEGGSGAVTRFLGRVRSDAPPLAVVERVLTEERPARGRRHFHIRQSWGGVQADAPVAPDAATCEACLAELFDPTNRRFRYPFINCTDCGPRFTIVVKTPYDRPHTTMEGFRMCARCQAEYEDPANRRFHAQPNACPECGPAASLLDSHGVPVGETGVDAVRAAADALRDGEIVAVKGIGGYHLACRADHEPAVWRLRARKHREDRPFAVMAGALADAHELVELTAAERALLCSPQRPIVLAARLAGAAVAPSVAPGMPELGMMLPYSPLHHLLLADVGCPLVMTSGNVADEPIAYRDDDALGRLEGIAELLLVHDRPIETRTDDSVARVVTAAGAPRAILVRRSRGYVPAELSLPEPGTPRALLACGGELKNAFCLAKGTRAWPSHHVGDLENFDTLRSFAEGVEHFQRLFAVSPEIVVHDLHPDYLSTKYALARDGVELLDVQHHHAHFAACLAEHGFTGDAVGAIFDGSGYGSDGTVWGGEVLAGDLAEFRRVGALLPVALPGGEQAIRQPWRMACAWLSTLGEQPPELPRSLAGRVDWRRWMDVCSLVRTGVASPPTTSMGRLFDAVAALCGLRAEVTYEGQAAIELEAACDPGEKGRYPFMLSGRDGLLVLDPRETLRALLADLACGVGLGVVAARFHAAMADVTVQALVRAADATHTDTAVLSGGVFQNRRLLEATTGGLHIAGLRVLVPERLPANDGGIAYGQASVAAARLARQ